MTRQLSALLSLVLSATVSFADDRENGFADRVFTGEDGKKSKYVVFVPHGFSKLDDAKYPVILFLHGAGETGSDGQKQARVGLGPAIRKREKDFPFVAVFPQASHADVPVRQRWHAGSPDADRALAILDEVMAAYRGDPERVYLTGLSMGGYGTWSLAAALPEKWAAVVPVCGGGNPCDAAVLAAVPTWCFHGDADRAVPVEQSRQMIAAVKAAGGEPKYTEYPGVGHNSWDQAYGTPELYDWMLKHGKRE